MTTADRHGLHGAPERDPEQPHVDPSPRRRRGWMRIYDQRIDDGLEHCRECGDHDGLRICRISYSRAWCLANCTILCTQHGNEYLADFQPSPHRRLLVSWRLQIKSLAFEEDARDPDQRWGRAAAAAAAQRFKGRMAARS